LAAKYRLRQFCTKPSENRELIYTNVPNICGCNSQGYFDRERSYQKTPGIFRIVVIGDSLAAGQGLQRDEKFSQVLENRLNDRAAGKFEVLVLARSGYSQSQELIVLENEAFRYEPDLILWSYVLNDPAHPVYHDANGELGKYYYRPRSHLAHFFSARLFALRENIKSRHCPPEFHEMLHCVYWEDVKANFTRLSRLGTERNVRIILLIHPVFEQGRNFKQYTLVNLHRRLRDLVAQKGLPVLDLLHAFLDHDPEEIRQSSPNSYDPWHPNAAGHALIACALEGFLRSGGHLPTTE
jgi:lysophospholipase L1-like esterase